MIEEKSKTPPSQPEDGAPKIVYGITFGPPVHLVSGAGSGLIPKTLLGLLLEALEWHRVGDTVWVLLPFCPFALDVWPEAVPLKYRGFVNIADEFLPEGGREKFCGP